MAISKTSKVLIPAGTSCAAGISTKASPQVTGTVVDCTTYYGGELSYRITNGSAPTTPCNITFQVSPDNTNWYDYFTATGDITLNSTFSNTIYLDRGAMWVRAIAWGNQTNPVTVEAVLQAVSGV